MLSWTLFRVCVGKSEALFILPPAAIVTVGGEREQTPVSGAVAAGCKNESMNHTLTTLVRRSSEWKLATITPRSVLHVRHHGWEGFRVSQKQQEPAPPQVIH